MSKDLVKKGYNKSAERYLKRRNQFRNNKYLEKLNKHLKKRATILDIGCGAGKPIDYFFIKKGHKVIGIDFSKKQIDLAKKNVPEAEYKVQDFSKLKRNEYKVDAVVSFYAIFHIPRRQHQVLFKRINSFLPRGGLILVTMGSTAWEGVEEDFHGSKMYWSHYDPKKNKGIIKSTGFKIIFDEIDKGGRENHQIILAKKL
jgi:cyclopropane fatty-acyl-phospholipid synthase-like methyltransferase